MNHDVPSVILTDERGAHPPTRRLVALLGGLLLITLLAACGTKEAVANDLFGSLVSTSETGTIGNLDGSVVSGTITVLVESHHRTAEVWFYLDGGPEAVHVDVGAPFEMQLDTTELADGPHTLTATSPKGAGTRHRTIAEASFTVANVAASEPGPDPTSDPGAGAVFAGHDGRVVIYAERSEPNGWTTMNDETGFTGSSYYRWQGDISRDGPGPVQLRYDFTVDVSAPYLVRLRLLTEASEENDVWARLNGGTWYKVHTVVRDEWTFDTVIEVSHGVSAQWIETLEPGRVHTLELTAREHVALDQVRVWQQGASGLHDATWPESSVSGETPPTPVDPDPDPEPDPEPEPEDPVDGQTTVSIVGSDWYVNGTVTNDGAEAEGMLINSRMVNAIFEDENSATVTYWGTNWDPERNTDAFIAMIPTYASYGLDAVTISLQGGRPRYGNQDWINTAFRADGSLKSAYMDRAARVIEALDANGMVAILTLFYFGQDQRITSEAAVKTAVDRAVDWVLAQGFTNVVIEVANESDHSTYDHAILRPDRVHELIERVRTRSGGRLLASVSMMGGQIAPQRVLDASDFHLPHGNGQSTSQVTNMVATLRSRSPGKPIDFNEDSTNLANMKAALDAGAGWGYYDRTGYQTVPADWGINTTAKKAFFDLVRNVTTPR